MQMQLRPVAAPHVVSGAATFGRHGRDHLLRMAARPVRGLQECGQVARHHVGALLGELTIHGHRSWCTCVDANEGVGVGVDVKQWAQAKLTHQARAVRTLGVDRVHTAVQQRVHRHMSQRKATAVVIALLKVVTRDVDDFNVVGCEAGQVQGGDQTVQILRAWEVNDLRGVPRDTEASAADVIECSNRAVLAHQDQLLLVDPRDAHDDRILAACLGPDRWNVATLAEGGREAVREMRAAHRRVQRVAQRLHGNSVPLESLVDPAKMLRQP